MSVAQLASTLYSFLSTALTFLVGVLTGLVAFHDGFRILYQSYKYGPLSNFRVFQIRLTIWLLPRYLRERLQRFSDDDIDIQIKKLHKNKKAEQLNALEHLEQILKFTPPESANKQDSDKVRRIQREIFRLLWQTKTDSEVVKKAVDMLCKNNYLRSECGCAK